MKSLGEQAKRELGEVFTIKLAIGVCEDRVPGSAEMVSTLTSRVDSKLKLQAYENELEFQWSINSHVPQVGITIL